MRILQLAFIVALASGFAAILIYITGVSDLDRTLHVSDEEIEALQLLQSGFQKCVAANGLGMQAIGSRDYCKVTLQFPSDTIPKWFARCVLRDIQYLIGTRSTFSTPATKFGSKRSTNE